MSQPSPQCHAIPRPTNLNEWGCLEGISFLTEFKTRVYLHWYASSPHHFVAKRRCATIPLKPGLTVLTWCSYSVFSSVMHAYDVRNEYDPARLSGWSASSKVNWHIYTTPLVSDLPKQVSHFTGFKVHFGEGASHIQTENIVVISKLGTPPSLTLLGRVCAGENNISPLRENLLMGVGCTNMEWRHLHPISPFLSHGSNGVFADGILRVPDIFRGGEALARWLEERLNQ